jgi:ADP-ribose pyrophosphatase YjhB (NUDIX family)
MFSTDFLPPTQSFVHCPGCGGREHQIEDGKRLVCSSCRFVFYFNPAVACAAIITDPQENLLFVKRARDPAKGKLGLPGGFIDPWETSEDALLRETKEELNLTIIPGSLDYVTSHPNVYRYRGVAYPVLDLFYTCAVESFEPIQSLDEVDGYVFIPRERLNIEAIAFVSMKYAVRVFLGETPERMELPSG